VVLWSITLPRTALHADLWPFWLDSKSKVCYIKVYLATNSNERDYWTPPPHTHKYTYAPQRFTTNTIEVCVHNYDIDVCFLFPRKLIELTEQQVLSERSSTPSDVRCSARWIVHPQSRASYAREVLQARTQQQCLEACISTSSCVAVEWGSGCWMHDTNRHRARRPLEGVTQLEIVRRCYTMSSMYVHNDHCNLFWVKIWSGNFEPPNGHVNYKGVWTPFSLKLFT